MIHDQKTFLTVLLTQLVDLRDRHKHKFTEGICKYITFEQKRHVEPIFKIWPKFSGQRNFPVPSPHKSVSHGGAYFKYNRWSKKSKYGQLRYELLDFVITTIEQQLKELS